MSRPEIASCRRGSRYTSAPEDALEGTALAIVPPVCPPRPWGVDSGC